MRTIPESMAADLAAGVTRLAHVWRVTRRDGAAYAFTDHDRPLMFDGEPSEPLTSLDGGAIEKSLGLGVDTASIAGALSSAALSEEEFARGLWDGARVEIYRVDWRAPEQRVHLFAGAIGEVRRGAGAFEAELRGLQAALNVPIGRVFSRFCDADLGDARCGKDIETSAFKGDGVVTAVLGSNRFHADGLEAFADGVFTRGRVVWSGGGESEVAAHRIEDGAAAIELTDAPSAALAEAATFAIYAGCDKRFETCRTKFANSVNFQGFPHMPGNDVVQAGPVAGDMMDGGSRFR